MPRQQFNCDSSISDSKSSRSSNYCSCELCYKKQQNKCCKYHKKHQKCKKYIVHNCSDTDSDNEKEKKCVNKCNEIDYDVCKKNGKVIVITIN